MYPKELYEFSLQSNVLWDKNYLNVQKEVR